MAKATTTDSPSRAAYWARKTHLLARSIAWICGAIMFCSTVYVVFIVGPTLEMRYAPAVPKLRILDLVPDDAGNSLVQAEFTKSRGECEYSASHGSSASKRVRARAGDFDAQGRGHIESQSAAGHAAGQTFDHRHAAGRAAVQQLCADLAPVSLVLGDDNRVPTWRTIMLSRYDAAEPRINCIPMACKQSSVDR
jgi:hypothetical protein